MNLLDGKHPSHAAILLFSEEPQRFIHAAEVKCLHFHGTEIRKPILSYQIYKGTNAPEMTHMPQDEFTQLCLKYASNASRKKWRPHESKADKERANPP